jgi:hypothetical protein
MHSGGDARFSRVQQVANAGLNQDGLQTRFVEKLFRGHPRQTLKNRLRFGLLAEFGIWLDDSDNS